MRAYEVWSEENGLPVIGRNEFYDRVRRMDSCIKDQKVQVGSQRLNGFSGIALQVFEPAEEKKPGAEKS